MLGAQAGARNCSPRPAISAASSTMPDCWAVGSTMEVSGDGATVTKKSGGNYPRHASGKEVLSEGVHTWEVELTSGAASNNNRDIFIGVALAGCDVEKGNHQDKGKAWYLRTHDGNIYGGDIETEDADHKGKHFVVGDRIGVQLDCNEGSLRCLDRGHAIHFL